ncbi:MAG: hypothetical protein MUF52_16050 [Syntrophobacteraceae bacterium]|nr:hypothetical protein [Syntrophobacteraceae bacterium]
MKCNKCGFVSFDHLSDCKKCGVNLVGARTLLGMLDFKPTMPFFLGAMVHARPEGPSGTPVARVEAPAPAGLPGMDFGGDLEIEIDGDGLADLSQPENRAGQDLFPNIELPEGFSLSLGDEEKGDEFDLVIGPEFEQSLARELNAGELGLQGGPEEATDELAGLRFDEPLLDTGPGAPRGEGSGLESRNVMPDLGLDLALAFDPLETSAGPGVGEVEMATGGVGEDGLMMDFSQNDLEGLLLELDDKAPEA